jgi:hypothetical protein
MATKRSGALMGELQDLLPQRDRLLRADQHGVESVRLQTAAGVRLEPADELAQLVGDVGHDVRLGRGGALKGDIEDEEGYVVERRQRLVPLEDGATDVGAAHQQVGAGHPVQGGILWLEHGPNVAAGVGAQVGRVAGGLGHLAQVYGGLAGAAQRAVVLRVECEDTHSLHDLDRRAAGDVGQRLERRQHLALHVVARHHAVDLSQRSKTRVLGHWAYLLAFGWSIISRNASTRVRS